MSIAYVGPYLSLAGGAGLQRAVGISRSLAGAGSEVLIGAGDSGGRQDYPLALNVRGWSVGETSRPAASRARKLADRAGWGQATVAWLRQHRSEIHAVIVYGGGAVFARRVMAWAERNSVPVLIDCVEWYDGAHQPLGRFGPVSIDFEVAMRSTYSRCNYVICISEYLAAHFRAKGCHTIVVPPTLDVREMPWSPKVNNDRTVLTYAGSPGKKDLLDAIIRGTSDVDPRGDHVSLNVVGISESQLRSLPSCSGTGSLPRFIRTHGQVTRARVIDLVSGSDFAPLLREEKRFASAGFPTKVVEALSLGTPAICNLTSDLAKHIRDGETGVVASSPSSNAFAEALTRSLSLTQSTYEEMRSAARDEAETSFDFRVFIEPLAAFMDQAVS